MDVQTENKQGSTSMDPIYISADTDALKYLLLQKKKRDSWGNI